MVQPTERADARANRGRLIAAAQAVLRERGLDAEMKEIAERAGLGIGTIYRNFPTKDDLVAAIIGEVIDRIEANIDAAGRMDDPVEAIRRLLRGGFEVTERCGDLLMTVMQGKMPDECQSRFKAMHEADHVGAIIRAGIAAGAFRADLDPGIVAAQLTAAFIPWQYQQLRRTRSAEQIVDAYVNPILHGILSR